MTAALSEYRATLWEMDDGRIELGGKPEQWNRLVNRLQSLHMKLRQTSDGRQAITNLIDDENPTVRLWSASHALAWSPRKAQKALEGLAEGVGLTSFDAKITLREFRSGRFKTDWAPKDR
jgi:hypothetical protein